MRVKHAKSLLWFSRWYNGRYEHLNSLYDRHSVLIEELVREKLGKRKSCYQRRFNICGIRVVATCTPYSFELHEVGSADKYTGLQRELFTPMPRKNNRGLKVSEVRHETAA